MIEKNKTLRIINFKSNLLRDLTGKALIEALKVNKNIK
jgi:hypothetical protein